MKNRLHSFAASAAVVAALVTNLSLHEQDQSQAQAAPAAGPNGNSMQPLMPQEVVDLMSSKLNLSENQKIKCCP